MAKKSKQKKTAAKKPAKPAKKAGTSVTKAAKSAKKAVDKAAKKANRATLSGKTAKASPAKKAAPVLKAKATPAPVVKAATPKPAPKPAPRPLAVSPAAGAPAVAKVAEAPATASAPTAKPTIAAPDHLTIDHAHYGPLSEEALRKVKTDLTKKDLEHFRAILLEKRAEILGDVEHMESNRASANGEMSHMPLHPADVGSDHYDQEFNLGLMQSEKALLREIDEALLRIQNGTYGVCMDSGKPIPRARLEIKPWAKHTIEVAMEREKRGLR